MEDIEKIREQMKEYADSQEGCELNPNENAVNGILKGLLMNKEKKGDIYCPCRVTTGDKEKDKNIACPCVFHKQELVDDGHCKCNLFVRPE